MTNKERFDTCRITDEKKVDAVIERIIARRSRYDPVVKATGVPWFFLGTIHELEGAGRFTGHLHNGDPLTARTKRVPPGRPVKGDPPFTWEESAIDAMEYMKFAGSGENRLNWAVGPMLDRLEKYNGPGYKNKGMASPYLWAGSQHYTKGKYVADGVFDPEAVSQQIGGAVILCRMFDRGLIQL